MSWNVSVIWLIFDIYQIRNIRDLVEGPISA